MLKRAGWLVLGVSVGCLLPACNVVEKHAIALPSVFSDHAVFQQGREIPVWGTAEPGCRVVVRFAGQRKGAVAGGQGRWTVRLDPVAAGGPYELTASIGLTEVRREDILVGEVWVCSGQSNMEFALRQANNSEQEVADANCPAIRLFTVPKKLSSSPERDVAGQWSLCKPETSQGFSAVGYLFGRQLHEALHVPIGLINASWGGSRAEPWTPRRDLEMKPEFAARLAEYDRRYAAETAELPKRMAAYEQALRKFRVTFAGFMKGLSAKDRGTAGRWQMPATDTGDWKTMKLPVLWESAGLADFDGIVWFRRAVDVPAAWAGKDLALELGPIDDDDVTYFNGVKVGAIGYGTDGHWQLPRKYTVPGKLVAGGKNVIVCRVFDGGGGGGIYGAPGQMKLTLAAGAGGQVVSLAGPWKYRVGLDGKDETIPNSPPRPGQGRNVGTMYNAMIAPLVPYGIAGVLWYQGESNAGQPGEYARLFPTMIRAWRRQWGQGDFAFLFVQLANFLAPPKDPDEGGWAWVREAQTRALSLPKVGMAVTIDIGNAKDIHPRNKQDVGKRLALAALAKQYGRKGVFSGPIYESMAIEGSTIRLRFRHVGGGLVARGGPLKQFAIAGEDRKFVWAEARIEKAAGEAKPGDSVVVSSKLVPKPVAVRYAWASNPEGCNLVNKESLPASPFRTDDWPRPTK